VRRLIVLTCLFVVAAATPAAATLPTPTLNVEPLSTVVTVGSSITVAGTVTDPANTPGLSIVVERSTDGLVWGAVNGSPATTASDGTFSASDTPPATGVYSYRASWAGDGVSYDAGEATSTTSLTVLPQSTLTIDPDVSSSYVGQTVSISGALTDPPDIEGASIVITRSSDGFTYNAIATSPATTDVNGAFSVTDTLADPGTYTYRAAWDGDGAQYGSGAAIGAQALTVTTYPASLTLHASAATIVYGDTLKLSGLWSSASGLDPADPTVTIARTKSGGSTVDLTTTLDGTDHYKLLNTPGSAGTFTYVASVAGDDTHADATSSSVEVVVAKRWTGLGLRVTHGTVTYGDPTTLVATLRRGEAGSKVRFEKKSGTSWVAMATVPVSSDGVARLKVTPGSKQTYRAVFDATANLKASISDTSTVQVRPVMVSRMIGTFTKDGEYAVYACCTAYFYVKLKPIHPRLSWTATVQYYGHGQWRKLGSGSYRFQSNGSSAIYLNASSGYRYRVRGHFDGDGDHLSATSAWNYFKFK
jgi:hypothetical protein